MLRDALLTFVGAPLSLVGAPGQNFATNPYDVLGVGAGNPPPGIIGNAALFGSDLGVGGFQPELVVIIGTALVTATAATLNAQFQAAPDTGSAGGYLPGTWQTIDEQGPITAAQGLANTYIARFKWPPVFPATLRPRFYRLNFAVPAGTDFTAGTISNAFVTTVRDDYSQAQAAKNYTVQ
jgi:hypothetical protein